MLKRYLGRTQLEIPEIGFGTWGIGGNAYGPTDDQLSKRALECAFENGINFFDTANIYGMGRSEELLGATFKGKRDSVIFATKVGMISEKGDQDFSPQWLRESLEGSLRRLQTDYVDILQLHCPPVALLKSNPEILDTVRAFVQEGKVKHWGISWKSPTEGMMFSDHPIQPEFVQINFNLMDQRALDSGYLNFCKENQIGIIARTPLGSGFLVSHDEVKSDYGAKDHRSQWKPQVRERSAKGLDLFMPLIDEDASPVQKAIRFCLAFKEISVVIPGMLTPEQVLENAKASRSESFSPQILDRIRDAYCQSDFYGPPR